MKKNIGLLEKKKKKGTKKGIRADRKGRSQKNFRIRQESGMHQRRNRKAARKCRSESVRKRDGGLGGIPGGGEKSCRKPKKEIGKRGGKRCGWAAA